MIKPGFGIRNILITIINIPLMYICILSIWAGLQMLIGGNISASVIVLMAIIFTGLSWDNIRTQIFPKHFKCMSAVTEYIKYKDLKELLEDEKFVPFEFPQDIVQVLREHHVKAKQYKIQCSQNWVYAQGVYIPKKMIRGTFAWEGGYNRLDEMAFELIDGAKIEFGYFDRCCGIPAAYFEKGIEIPTIKNKRAYSEKKFKESVKTREDFLDFLKES